MPVGCLKHYLGASLHTDVHRSDVDRHSHKGRLVHVACLEDTTTLPKVPVSKETREAASSQPVAVYVHVHEMLNSECSRTRAHWQAPIEDILAVLLHIDHRAKTRC